MQHEKNIFIVVSTFSVCQLNIKSSFPLIVAAVTAAGVLVTIFPGIVRLLYTGRHFLN